MNKGISHRYGITREWNLTLWNTSNISYEAAKWELYSYYRIKYLYMYYNYRRRRRRRHSNENRVQCETKTC